MNRKATFVAVMVIVALVAAAGCGSKPAAEKPSGGETKPTEPIRVVFIPKNTGNPYFDAIINGFKKASQELGFEFTTTGPATPEATSQIPFVKEQIQRGVDVLAIAPNSPDALNPVFDEARQKGIKVMIVNSDIPGSESHRDVAVLPMDFEITGKFCVELMASLIDSKGEIAILSATADAPDQNYWIQGMKETLKDPKYKDMQLVAVAYGDDLPDKSLVEAEALLTKYPDLRGIIAPTTVGIAAAAQAVETAKRAPQVQVTGLGTPNQMRRFIKNGTVRAFGLWDPYLEGYLSGYLAVGMVKGEIVPAEGAKFMVPGAGERVFRKNNVVITGPPVTFTKDNIDNYDF